MYTLPITINTRMNETFRLIHPFHAGHGAKHMFIAMILKDMVSWSLQSKNSQENEV